MWIKEVEQSKENDQTIKYMIQSIKKAAIFLLLVFTFVLSGIAQPPPPPTHGQNEDQPAAPIGSGIIILLALAGAYGAKKVYDARKKIRE